MFTANVEKQDALPVDWIGSEAVFPSEEKRKTYIFASALAVPTAGRMQIPLPDWSGGR